MSTKSWYVAQNGRDTNAGTLAAPFATFAKANAMVQPGQQILVRGGTYRQAVKITKSGTAAQPITIAAYNGEVPIVNGKNADGSDIALGEGLFMLDGGVHHVTVAGIVVLNSSKFGLEICGHDNTIRGCAIANAERAGLIISDLGSSYDISGNTIDGNTISGCCQQNVNFKMSAQGGGWDSALNTYHGGGGAAGGTTYSNNYVHDNWGEGIVPADGDTVTRNRFKDNWSVHIYLADKQNCTVTRNLCWDVEGSPQHVAGRRAQGIGFADESSPARGTGHVVTNNILLNCGYGIRFWNANTSGTGLKSCHIVNNTIANSVTSAIDIDAGSHSLTIIRNNIVWPRLGNILVGTSASGLTVDHNIVKGVNADPGLVGLGSSTDFDVNHYKIPGTGSSARNAGSATTAPASDYFGTSRPQSGSYDVGAHELV